MPFTGGGKNATIVTTEGGFAAQFISFPFTLGISKQAFLPPTVKGLALYHFS
jgi:hypothetical protein